MSKAYELEALKRYGIKPSELGCVMLDVEMPDLSDVIAEEWEYYSSHPNLRHVTGIQREGHITLLYGLLPMVDKAGVDEVLSIADLPPVVLAENFEVFSSPISSEPYSCIVARVEHPMLRKAHGALSLLPHINTYPEYKTHITLAYVWADYVDQAQDALYERYPVSWESPLAFTTTTLNYGKRIK